MDVLTFETCWAVNSEIIKQVTSSWSIFIQHSRCLLHLRSIQFWTQFLHSSAVSTCFTRCCKLLHTLHSSLSLHPFHSFRFKLPKTLKILIIAIHPLHAKGFCINAVRAAWTVAAWHTYYGICIYRSKIRNSVPVLSPYGKSRNPGGSYCRKQHTLCVCQAADRDVFR